MNKCKRCGSYAINHDHHGRDGSDADLCDVCYWRKRAELLLEIKKSLQNVIIRETVASQLLQQFLKPTSEQ